MSHNQTTNYKSRLRNPTQLVGDIGPSTIKFNHKGTRAMQLASDFTISSNKAII
uniref:Uncharacterized protein n=1 Tax=Rhizophora mucronata TaxID=61149 RepID=A0A2P2J8H4_RHIMU